MTLPDFLTRDEDGFIHVAGHRIGLEHVIHYYNEGYSPEMLADELGIHRAIVAGRIRKVFKRYQHRGLSKMVGHNQVRYLFDEIDWQ